MFKGKTKTDTAHKNTYKTNIAHGLLHMHLSYGLHTGFNTEPMRCAGVELSADFWSVFRSANWLSLANLLLI